MKNELIVHTYKSEESTEESTLNNNTILDLTFKFSHNVTIVVIDNKLYYMQEIDYKNNGYKHIFYNGTGRDTVKVTIKKGYSKIFLCYLYDIKRINYYYKEMHLEIKLKDGNIVNVNNQDCW